MKKRKDEVTIRKFRIVQTEGSRQVIPDKFTPLFLYCQSGARSKRAVAGLQKMGYTSVVNLGGIASYRGEIER